MLDIITGVGTVLLMFFAVLTFLFGLEDAFRHDKCVYDRHIKFTPSYAVGCFLGSKR